MKKTILFFLLAYPLSMWAQKPQFVIQSGLQKQVIMASISADNRLGLTVEENETLLLWDLKSGKQLQSFKDIIAADFSKDGRSLEVVDNNYKFKTLDFYGKILSESTIKIDGLSKNNRMGLSYYRDAGLLLNTGYMYSKTKGIVGQIRNATAQCYSEKKNIIASSGDKDTVNIFKVPNGELEKTLNFKAALVRPDDDDKLKFTQFSTDGNLLAAGTDYGVEIKEMASGKSVFTFKYYIGNRDHFINTVNFSPDGTKLLVFCNNQVSVFDIATKKQVWKIDHTLGGNPYGGRRVVARFSDDGSQVLIGYYLTLMCLDAASGANIAKLAGIVKSEVHYNHLLEQNLVLEQENKALNWSLTTGELKKITPAELPFDIGGYYHLAINKKANKFYNYLNEIDEKTEVATTFEELRYPLDGTPSRILLSADEKQLLHLSRFRVSTNGTAKDVRKLVVSSVQTKKIVWQKDNYLDAVFSSKGDVIAASPYKGDTKLSEFYFLDPQKGDILKTFTLPKADYVSSFTFSINDKYLTFMAGNNHMIMEVATGKITEVDAKLLNSKEDLDRPIFSTDEKNLVFVTYAGYVHFYNIEQRVFEKEKSFRAHQSSVTKLSMTKNGRFLFSNARENSVKLWDVQTRTLLATLYSNPQNGDWAVVTPDGRFDGTKGMQESMYFVKGIDVIPLVGMFEKFYTPHLLSRILAGEKFDPSPVKVDDLKAVPTVKIIIENKQRNLVVGDDIPSYTIENEQVTLKIKADCPNDVVTEIQLFQNGKLVGSTRNLTVEDDTPNGEKSMLKTFNIVLNNGENRFKAVALNSQRTESQPDEIILNFKSKTTPSVSGSSASDIQLYLVVIGINKYRNPKYNLNYATADATSFKEAIEKGGTGIFSKTNVVFIGDAQATKDGISAELEKIKTTAKPQDVFIFYFAGHGVLNQKKEFYLVPYDVTQLYGQDEALAQKGLSANQLQQFSKDIKAQKQLFILDACQSAGAIDQVMASRGAAEEKAISQLARATGTHWLTASGSEQFASEFEQLKHGTFTYVLLEALSGKADLGGDKKITVKELDAYLQEQVPVLTEKYKGTPQFPASYGFGNDFPIGVVKQ